jgi:hypothetical protein
MGERAYADPNHPGNKIRARLRCVGCGTKGCITAWGPWCFDCNVKRMDRIGAALDREANYRLTGIDKEPT